MHFLFGPIYIDLGQSASAFLNLLRLSTCTHSTQQASFFEASNTKRIIPYDLPISSTELLLKVLALYGWLALYASLNTGFHIALEEDHGFDAKVLSRCKLEFMDCT